MTDSGPASGPARPSSASVARIVAERAESVPGVEGLDGGPLGLRVTLEPTGRIEGVTVRDRDGHRVVEVAVILGWGADYPAISSAVRTEVTDGLARRWPGGGPWTIDVVWSD